MALTWIWRAGAAATVALSGLIIVNTLPYFTTPGPFAFLIEKGSLATQPLWRAAFYLHIAGGMVCLATGPILQWAGLLKRSRALHARLGRVYGIAVLGVAGPAGLLMALHAKGGLAGQSGFIVQGLLWWIFTALGVLRIATGDVAAHRRWMDRSYAMALSAVFFRALQLLYSEAGMDDHVNYIVSLWLSTAVSLAVGETMISRSQGSSLREFQWKGVPA